MTPKQKAQELVNKFRDFANGSDYETDGFSPNIEKENGKECALIAVDEILKDQPFDVIKLEYWNKVKEEIKKL